jgi:hypothetical protein
VFKREDEFGEHRSLPERTRSPQRRTHVGKDSTGKESRRNPITNQCSCVSPLSILCARLIFFLEQCHLPFLSASAPATSPWQITRAVNCRFFLRNGFQLTLHEIYRGLPAPRTHTHTHTPHTHTHTHTHIHTHSSTVGRLVDPRSFFTRHTTHNTLFADFFILLSSPPFSLSRTHTHTHKHSTATHKRTHTQAY